MYNEAIERIKYATYEIGVSEESCDKYLKGVVDIYNRHGSVLVYLNDWEWGEGIGFNFPGSSTRKGRELNVNEMKTYFSKYLDPLVISSNIIKGEIGL